MLLPEPLEEQFVDDLQLVPGNPEEPDLRPLLKRRTSSTAEVRRW